MRESNTWNMGKTTLGTTSTINKVLRENGVIRRGHIEDNLNNFYNK